MPPLYSEYPKWTSGPSGTRGTRRAGRVFAYTRRNPPVRTTDPRDIRKLAFLPSGGKRVIDTFIFSTWIVESPHKFHSSILPLPKSLTKGDQLAVTRVAR